MSFVSVQVIDFKSWRREARDLIGRRVPPERIDWSGGEKGSAALLSLGFSEEPVLTPVPKAKVFSVSKKFLQLAEFVSNSSETKKWDVLYRLLWRMTVEGERTLLEIASDPDVRQVELWRKAVGREVHKMKAFVRFRLVKEGTSDSDRENYVAWYEPVHNVVSLVAPFFRDRITSMNWSILTPHSCVHWDGEGLRFTAGIDGSGLSLEDDVEGYWKKYYSNIFNPARLNVSMMEREMPRRYWKNLPEAELIGELTQKAYGRTRKMIEKSEKEDGDEESK